MNRNYTQLTSQTLTEARCFLVYFVDSSKQNSTVSLKLEYRVIMRFLKKLDVDALLGGKDQSPFLMYFELNWEHFHRSQFESPSNHYFISNITISFILFLSTFSLNFAIKLHITYVIVSLWAFLCYLCYSLRIVELYTNLTFKLVSVIF